MFNSAYCVCGRDYLVVHQTGLLFLLCTQLDHLSQSPLYMHVTDFRIMNVARLMLNGFSQHIKRACFDYHFLY